MSTLLSSYLPDSINEQVSKNDIIPIYSNSLLNTLCPSRSFSSPIVPQSSLNRNGRPLMRNNNNSTKLRTRSFSAQPTFTLHVIIHRKQCAVVTFRRRTTDWSVAKRLGGHLATENIACSLPMFLSFFFPIVIVIVIADEPVTIGDEGGKSAKRLVRLKDTVE
uniref:Uncharacterized protein n=1 Tax=Caenorhabditis japonica TaxID=281687 RepID=A0A8R1IH66_CAEJA